MGPVARLAIEHEEPRAQRSGGILQPPVSVPPRKPRRSKQLRVLPRGWKPVDGVPATRAECPTVRPCPHLKCEHNSWMDDGRDRPGGYRPDGERRKGETSTAQSRVTVRAAQNCVADIIDRATSKGVTVPLAVIEDTFEVSERSVCYTLASALSKLRANPDLLREWAELVREYQAARERTA